MNEQVGQKACCNMKSGRERKFEDMVADKQRDKLCPL